MGWGRSEEGWTWLREPSISLGSSGPVRVDTGTPAPDLEPAPVGFTAALAHHGTPKPVTESRADTDLADVLARVPDHLATLSHRCPECGDCDGRHFRCCSSYPKE